MKKELLFVGTAVLIAVLIVLGFGNFSIRTEENQNLGSGIEIHGAGTSTAYSIGISTTTTILSGENGAVYVAFTNYGPGFVTILDKQTATSTGGIRLLDVGDFHEMYGDNLILTNLYAIASSSTSTLGVYFHR